MSFLLSRLRRGLALIGRHGARGFVVALLLGLALPGVAAAVRPVLPVSIFMFVMLSFARADFDGVKRAITRPARLAIATIWITVAMPLLIEIGLLAVGRHNVDPGLLLGVALVAAGPPLMGFAAYAALLGLDNSLAITLLVMTMSATPLMAPPIASFIAGAAVPLDPAILGLRLLWLLAGAGGGAFAMRRLLGPERIVALRHELDGLYVLLYFVFAVAAMDGVIAAALTSPMKVALYLVVGTGLTVLGLMSTMLAMRALGRAEAFVLGLGTGMRNTGLLVAAMGATLPTDAFLFFSMLQFPIYCAPLAVAPLARRIRGAQGR
jgi:BASS family bile acid:Na+ symporter